MQTKYVCPFQFFQHATTLTIRGSRYVADHDELGVRIAEPEVVGLHGRVVATFEGAFVARTQRATDERLGAVLVEQSMAKASRLPAGPRGNALVDVLWQLS